MGRQRPSRSPARLLSLVVLAVLLSLGREARADGVDIMHLGHLAGPGLAAEAPVPAPLTKHEAARLRAFLLLRDVTSAALPQLAALASPSYARAMFVPTMFCLAQTCALSEAVAASKLPAATSLAAGSTRFIMAMGSGPRALLTWFVPPTPPPDQLGTLTLRVGPVSAIGGPALGLRGRW